MNPPQVDSSSSSEEACPTCGAKSWQSLFESLPPNGKNAYTIGRCSQCGLVRTLGVNFDDGSVTYPAFDQNETAVTKVMRTLVGQLLRERAHIVSQATNGKHGRLMDVGCGNGAFARLMAKRGFEVVGVEPFSLGEPTQEENLTLLRAPFESVRDEVGKFDVITMWHVLEHIDSPRPLLESLRDLLTPNGVLVVSVPNFDSWQSQFFKGGWFHLDPPRHVTHFDHATLKALFDEVHLTIEDERTFHIEYGPVGWLQSALNQFLPRKNFIYEIVKDRGALANVPISQTALNIALSGVAGVALAAPSVIVEAIAGMRNAGSVITVIARAR